MSAGPLEQWFRQPSTRNRLFHTLGAHTSVLCYSSSGVVTDQRGCICVGLMMCAVEVIFGGLKSWSKARTPRVQRDTSSTVRQKIQYSKYAL